MAKINDTIVKRILDATHIEDVVGKFVELKKRGPRYLGLCPFHDDRHIGNFSVYPKGNCYKCFACDAKGDAVTFLMESQKMSFADAIRWLGKQVGIDVDGRNVDLDIKAYEPPPPLPTLFLPEQMVAATEVRATHNNLIAWLNGLPWSSRQRERIDEVLAAYHVGTSKWGDAIFWQIDENGGVRDGKMMKYLPDGHRDKSTPYSINWVSRRLFKNGYFDESKWEPRRCLFGLHLLTRYPTAEVHVVESEKTALFCAIYFGDPERHLWLATAGKGNLTKHILQPLIDARRVVALHPDKDGVEDWEARRKEIGYKYAYVNNSVLTLQWQPQDGEKADVADVLQRVMRDAQRDGKVKKLADIMPRIHTAEEIKIQQDNGKELQGSTNEDKHPDIPATAASA